jgi:2-dehydro-3-deoxygluconokinase
MKPVVTFGEIMLRLTAPDHRRLEQAPVLETSFAGAEANVAVDLANLGMPARFVSRLPANELGTACLKYLRGQGVDVASVLRGGARMGLLFVETGAAQRGGAVIYDRKQSSFASLEPGMIDWEEAFRGAGWFHWTGITPALGPGPASVADEATAAARELGLTVSCDLNHRAKLWDWGTRASEVMPPLVRRCDVVIGNEEDAQMVFGIAAPEVDVEHGKVDPSAYTAVVEQLLAQFPEARTVALTLRGSLGASHNTWSALLWHNGRISLAPTYDIAPIVDRIGGGDAFAAALIYGLHRDAGDSRIAVDVEAALHFAVAASCLAHSIPGDAALLSVDEVQRLSRGHAAGRIAR